MGKHEQPARRAPLNFAGSSANLQDSPGAARGAAEAGA
jgi:hypothetical protein